MSVEFDHLFICTAVDAPEVDRLLSVGLTEGTASIHPGQGTANRRLFFHNAKLEFLWVNDPAEAQSAVIQPTHLWERWRDRQSLCPFGFCLRSTSPSNPVPFDHWDYRPPYLPASMSIAVGTNSAVLTEPMLFHTPFGQRPDAFAPEKAQPLDHALGLRELTRIEFISPAAAPLSAALQAVVETHLIKRRMGDEYGVELGFDGEQQHQHIDLRPALPLVLRW